ncbi:HD domain-containing phosphohydrolase [Desulfomicrobium baculatum]|uniref:Response regulator receiver modulated metal dependent phosphohydrolase n=1 Tax=Desulfomicrobium baculatum (strain DSM 4028 / VKM B-1378 / X) TaxID=525897 RepID=C7LSX2_DESBD|nr:HD domain-containing phosphohydrolase [Desulfomicrobium baculatum]ACU90722.1 response regulator receiver modulated metal dependent phosphohydrolase [Desulfomicrobium baculatum DSM 4028]
MDTSNQITTPTVLLIDDERMNRLIVGDYLRDSGYAVLEAESSSEGLRIFDNARPDIVITDLRMPGGDGNQVVTRLQNVAPDTPVIIISGTASLEEALCTLREGASDFITKPVREMDRIKHAIEAAMKKAHLNRENRLVKTALEDAIQQHTHDLRDLNAKLKNALESTVNALGVIVAQKDPYTAGHNDRVARIAMALGHAMALPQNRIETLRVAGNLHDIGKISVPEEILNKPGRLTPEEYEQVKIHPETGFDILKDIPFHGPVAEIVLQHHERYDGTGYPRGLKGNETLLETRILSVADIYEALTSDRPYRRGLPHEQVVAHIVREAGKQLCPLCVCAFVAANKSGVLSAIANSERAGQFPERP